MRKSVLIALACLLAVPAVGSAALMRRTGDGTLSVDSGRGKVTLEARGGVIGRFDRGLVTIHDLTPDDQFVPLVFGDEGPTRVLPSGAVVYSGSAIRFRLVGGRFKVFVSGTGIDLSAVGNGFVTLEADESRNPGTFSLDGDDCSSPKIRCRPLPAQERRFRLGLVDPEKSSTR